MPPKRKLRRLLDYERADGVTFSLTPERPGENGGNSILALTQQISRPANNGKVTFGPAEPIDIGGAETSTVKAQSKQEVKFTPHPAYVAYEEAKRELASQLFQILLERKPSPYEIDRLITTIKTNFKAKRAPPSSTTKFD